MELIPPLVAVGTFYCLLYKGVEMSKAVLYSLLTGIVVAILTAFISTQLNSCGTSKDIEKLRDTITNLQTGLGTKATSKELIDQIKEVNDAITHPEHGLAVLHERLTNHIESHNKTKRIFKEIYENATPAQKTILIKDASLFLLNPEIFLDIHVRDIPWLKQYAGEIKNLDVPIRTKEFIPSK